MRVLQLYNLFGAVSEQVWWQVPAALAREFAPVIGYETLVDGAAVPVGVESHPLPRIAVTPVPDPGAQMDALAASPAAPTANWTQIDLVHCHTGPRLLHAAPLLARRVPTLISLYGYDASRLLRDECWIDRYQWAARRGAVFAVLGEAMKRDLMRRGLPEASLVINRLGVDVQAWPYEPNAAPLPPRFVFIGRLVEKKGLDVLLSAIGKLPNVHLDVIGDGPLRSGLELAATERSLGQRVTFHGSVPRERLSKFLTSATAFVLPSRRAADGDGEGTPVVLMEAQALGLPAITTAHAGNAEVLPGGDFVVPENDPDALAAAMEKMVRISAESRLALQRAGRRHVEENYDLTQTVRNTARLYRQMLSRQSVFHPAG